MLWAQREFSEGTAQVERAAQVIGIVVDVPFDEQLPSKFLKCNRSTEVDVWSDLSLMRRSAPEVEHESALRGCVDLVSLNVCQHCSCTSVHILCTPANVVTSALGSSL